MGKKNHKIKEAKRKAKVKKRGIRTTIPWGKIRLVVVLVWLLAVQVFALFSPKSRFEKTKERVIRSPEDFEARLVLAEELLQDNQIEEAERELNIISNFQFLISKKSQNAYGSVLGTTSKLKELRQQKQENDPKDLEVLIRQWQEILEEKPDYRDGWLKLTLYLIKVGKKSEALEALKKAKGLDPNYEVAGELEKLLLQGNQRN